MQCGSKREAQCRGRFEKPVSSPIWIHAAKHMPPQEHTKERMLTMQLTITLCICWWEQDQGLCMLGKTSRTVRTSAHSTVHRQ